MNFSSLIEYFVYSECTLDVLL